jgi:hypothetical protein
MEYGSSVNWHHLENKTAIKQMSTAVVLNAVAIDAITAEFGVRPSIGIEVLSAMLDSGIHHAWQETSEAAYFIGRIQNTK